MTQDDLAVGGPETAGMPRLGLGTWQNTDPDTCAKSVETALEMGYRHIDTAQVYGNESAVGKGINAATVDREDIFLATKVWTDNLAPEDVRESTKASLDRLGTDYLDLLYVHWPVDEYEPEATLGAFQSLLNDGYIDRIGISNFEPAQVEQAVEVLDEPPFANQIEVHPLLPQHELRDVCDSHGIEIVGYSPLARGRVMEIDVIQEIAQSHSSSPAQVSLAWLRQEGLTAIPKATSEAHIRDNWSSLDLTLSESERKRIDAIETRDRQVDPEWAPWR